ILAAGLGGCQTMSDITGSLSSKPEASPEANPHRAAEIYGERYRSDPKNAEAALAYGQALRASGQRSQAAAVLEQATIAHPGDKPLLAAHASPRRHAAAGRLRAGACRQRQFPAGIRRSQPCALARQSRLEDPFGSG